MENQNNKLGDLIKKAEVVAIATCGDKKPHLVATWGDFVINVEGEKDRLLIPAGGYLQTEENLKTNGYVELLFGSKQLQGKNGMGSGYRVSGKAEIATSGKFFDTIKSKFSWARAALVISVESVEQLL